MPTIEVRDGFSLYYEEFGTGDKYVLSLMMGFPLENAVRALADHGYHVFQITNRGVGQSTHVFEDYGDHWFDVFADDVAAFADKLGIEKFVYMGCSHGAGTGWHLCLRHPERVTAFVALVGGPHNIDEGSWSYRQKLEEARAKGETVPPMNPETDDPAIRRRRERNAAYAEAHRREPAPEEKALDYRRPMIAYGTEAAVREALRTIQTPTLMIGGILDPISRPDLMLRTAECLPHGKTILYSGLGHGGPFEEIIEETVSETLFFLKNVEETGRVYQKVEG